MSTPFLGEIAAITSSLTWALANVAFARLPQSYAPFAIATLKSVLAAVFCAVTLLVLESSIWPALSSRELIFLVASALVGITIGDVMYFQTLKRLGARRAVFFSTLVPPASAAVAYFAFGESLSALQLCGMFLTLFGVVLVLYQRPVGRVGADDLRAGCIFGLIAVAFQVAANILTKEGAGEHSALAVSTVRLLIGSTGMLMFAAFSGRMREVFRPLETKESRSLVLVATLLGSYFGVWFYMAAIMYTEIGVAVTLSATSPIFITVLAHFFLRERATFRAFAGAAISVAGVALLMTS